ncbi:MAG: dUTPase [Spartobacteria bacterium]|nr:dUTPase [Spartobacteria bacterium]
MVDKDMLTEMFAMQEKLNERIGVHIPEFSEEDEHTWILNYCRAMSQELAELTDSVPWKWWANYQTYDRQNARVEVVDLFHFLISLAQVLGMSAQDIYELYVKKNAVNVHRQDTGYRTKDEADNRSLDLAP